MTIKKNQFTLQSIKSKTKRNAQLIIKTTNIMEILGKAIFLKENFNFLEITQNNLYTIKEMITPKMAPHNTSPK